MCLLTAKQNCYFWWQYTISTSSTLSSHTTLLSSHGKPILTKLFTRRWWEGYYISMVRGTETGVVGVISIALLYRKGSHAYACRVNVRNSYRMLWWEPERWLTSFTISLYITIYIMNIHLPKTVTHHMQTWYMIINVAFLYNDVFFRSIFNLSVCRSDVLFSTVTGIDRIAFAPNKQLKLGLISFSIMLAYTCLVYFIGIFLLLAAKDGWGPKREFF